MSAKFQVTESWIREFQSRNGGWTRDQFEALDISWPPREGWIRRIVGRWITDEQRVRFELGLDERAVRRAGRAIDMFA